MSNGMIAMPLFGRSVLLNTVAKSNGLICIPTGYGRRRKGSAGGMIVW